MSRTWQLLWTLCVVPLIVRAAPFCGYGSTIFTITSQGDADALSGCPVLNGSVSIVGDTLQSLKLNGVEEIAQSLVVRGSPVLRSFSALSLRSIDANFTLQELANLETVDVPALQHVAGWLNWEGLLSLKAASFPAGLTEVTNAKTQDINTSGVVISNTSISSLTGLQYVTAQNIEISYNQKLDNVNLSSLHRVTGFLDIEANGPKTTINLPAFTTSNDTLISGAHAIISPNLTTVLGQLNFTSNTITSLSFAALATVSIDGLLNISNNTLLAKLALPQLKNSGNLLIQGNVALTSISLPKVAALQSLVVKDNPVLVTISAPSLNRLSHDSYFNEAFTVTNNPLVVNITGIQTLTTILGIATLSGNFAEVSFPYLTSVFGAFRLNTTVPGFNCGTFDKLSQTNIYGVLLSSDRYHCSAIVPGSSADTAFHSIDQSSSSSSSITGQPLSDQAKIGISLGTIFFCVLVFIIAAQCYRARRLRANRQADGTEDVRLNTILPSYRPNPLPGEAPPRYKENDSVYEASDVESLGDFERRIPCYGPIQQTGVGVSGVAQVENRVRVDEQTEFANAVIADGTSGASREDLAHGSQSNRDNAGEGEGSAGTRQTQV